MIKKIQGIVQWWREYFIGLADDIRNNWSYYQLAGARIVHGKEKGNIKYKEMLLREDARKNKVK